MSTASTISKMSKTGTMVRLHALLGIDAGASLPYRFAQLLLRGRAVAALVRLFPHVDLSRPRAGDPLRILLQALYLVFVRQRGESAGAPVPLPLRRGARAARHGWRQARAFAQDWLGTRGKAAEAKAERIADHPLWDAPAVRWSAYGIAAMLALLCVTTPFGPVAQFTFVLVLWCIALAVRQVPGPVATLLLIVLSVTASARYMWWRVTETLNWSAPLDAGWGLLLLLAEMYTWVVLMLGYMQSAWPLRRQPLPLPPTVREWPSVDIYIPTYNEPLKVVRPTVYAATGIDWPRDRLNVYLLDDGRRDEMRQFAEEAGVGYIVRPDNRHAKAGNLNHALKQTGGEYIAIFDCDHIPTRSFLQSTMGWFLHDPKLALMQTPHHFFSPDPFERNLNLFRETPNEGELFYGVIQDGNDLWDATFFCGSCAVLRRGPLEEVGGIAVETVTEDAHTALKMHRLGYHSAYLNVPLAAGLATESLSAHIGQRIRWARGMAQIFRVDNPFFGRGLTWLQRVCYGNAMMHFLNGGPRLVFLTAPLAFLFFHAYVIYAPALAVLLYVLPHIAHANLTNSRIQGEHRHSFWAEVYETVLAWYTVRPTLVALLDPGKGKFNVTAKGGLVEDQYFDWTISLPYLVIVGLNVLGLGAGLWRLATGPADETGTVLVNIAWTVYNVLLLGAAISVASETRQVRLSHRVAIKLPAVLHLPDGRLLRCETVDFSESGAALAPLAPTGLQAGDSVLVSLWRGDEEHAFHASVIGADATRVRLQWQLASQEEQSMLVQCTFARADAWVDWAEGRPADRPLDGLKNVLRIGLRGILQLARLGMMPRHNARLARLGRWLGTLAPRPARPMENP
ncbi:UDP-forming cellulose synthase catalytic subunit [Pseudoduganella lutea]|uniref:Cellulose synthase catalytic subunit [UDP-forming] n=1 Tax=Pseudoduganella lutea TaxID=321985 RepID=A0A4P6L2L1_9BURK|nr:UDP-forming cellulose synthase catalytic subunit [Pseudoduganella lutea]QBE65790.1 UDP-forming cellulose synthase catalytic subunit [Pseudoduganella lutea]